MSGTITAPAGFFANDTVVPTTAADLVTAVANAQSGITGAATSATNAAASAAAASTSASNAAASSTSASSSASSAATSASNASAAASAAATSATNAGNSATAAAGSATAASNSATNAASSATNASTSATNASNSAAAASTSATNASNSATSASNSAAILSTFTAILAATGHITLPNSAGNLIINWGTGTLASGVATVTWNAAFGTACYGAVALPSGKSAAGTFSAMATGALGTTTGVFYGPATATDTFLYVAWGK